MKALVMLEDLRCVYDGGVDPSGRMWSWMVTWVVVVVFVLHYLAGGEWW